MTLRHTKLQQILYETLLLLIDYQNITLMINGFVINTREAVFTTFSFGVSFPTRAENSPLKTAGSSPLGLFFSPIPPTEVR